MVGRKISALALLLSCVSAPLHASASSDFIADCWQDSEVEALKVQRFKTMLLVATLNCRDMEPGITADYNRFVRANHDLITRKQSIVRQHFVRTYGPSAGLNAYSTFETSMGNQYSNDDFDDRRCASIADEARMAGELPEAELMDLVESVPDEDRFATCRTEPRLVGHATDWAPPQPAIYAESALDAAAPPAREPIETAQNEWPDLAPIEAEGQARAIDPNVQIAEATPPPPAPMPEKAAEPVEVASLDVSRPVQPTDRVQAVRDAARVLREALAALEGDGVR